jgi:multiple sugar transport system substrate-binding protein
MKQNNLIDTVTPATLKYYGEFPANSGKYWGFPAEGDACGWAYRKDLFENAKEKEGFKAKYGYELGVPKTMKELRDIAEWFYRPTANPPLYGIAVYTQKDYDAITMGVEQLLFPYGMEWFDAKTNKVKGVIDTDKGVAALQMYKDLYNFGPPGNNNSFYPEMNNYFTSGQVAMAMNFFAFFPALANKATNPYADTTGYFSNPAGPDGAKAAALGGQGLNINAHNSQDRIDASLAFLKWFASEKVQTRWAELGGYTCNAKVLASPEFAKIAPFNPAFAETMQMVKDFWNIPEFGQLLAPVQKYTHAFIVGNEGTAKEAMTKIADEHEKILIEAGYIK